MSRKLTGGVLLLFLTAMLGAMVPPRLGSAQDGSGINTNGCNINPDKPFMRDGTVEAPAFGRCEAALDGREIIVELWQRTNDGDWYEVEETDLIAEAGLAFSRGNFSLTNISCRRLDQDRTRRFKTWIAVSDGAGNFTGGFSNVEELRRDCLSGMDEAHAEELGIEARSHKRVRRPPRGAVAKKLEIECRSLRRDPDLLKKAKCPSLREVSGQEVDVEAYPAFAIGNCGVSWMRVEDGGQGAAWLSFGWTTILGPISAGHSNVHWFNFSRQRGDTFSQLWSSGRTWGSRMTLRETGAGLVGAHQTGLIDLVFPPGSTCTIERPYSEEQIT